MFRFVSVTLFVAILAVGFQIALEYAFRKEYTVHETGVVLITGTSSGIGRHAVFELAKLNYTVFSAVRKESDVKVLIKESRELGLDKYIIPIILDVTISSQIDEAKKTISQFLEESKLPFVGVVNNAGISARRPVEITEIDYVRTLFETNYFGGIEVTQKFLPFVRKDKGRLLYVSSIAGIVSLYGNGIYAATKRATEATVDSLRLELEPFGVSVTSILPGFVKTEIINKATAKWGGEEDNHPAYPNINEKLQKARTKNFETAPGPEVTSEVIIHALTSKYPQTRYYIGDTGAFPVKIVPIIVSIIPDRVLDWVKSNTL